MQPAFQDHNQRECIWSDRRLKIPIMTVKTELGIYLNCLLTSTSTLCSPFFLWWHLQLPPSSVFCRFSHCLGGSNSFLLFLFRSLSFLNPGCQVTSEGGMWTQRSLEQYHRGKACKQRQWKAFIMIITTVYCVSHVRGLCQAHYYVISFHPHPTLSGRHYFFYFRNAETKSRRDLRNWPKDVLARIFLIPGYRNVSGGKKKKKKKHKRDSVDRILVAPYIHGEAGNKTKTRQLPTSGITQTVFPMFLLG